MRRDIIWLVLLLTACGGKATDPPGSEPSEADGSGAERDVESAANTIAFSADGEAHEYAVATSQTGGHAVLEADSGTFALSIIPFEVGTFLCGNAIAAPGLWLRVGSARYVANNTRGSCSIDVTQTGTVRGAYRLQGTFTATLGYDGELGDDTGVWGTTEEPDPDALDAASEIEVRDGVIDAMIPAG